MSPDNELRIVVLLERIAVALEQTYLESLATPLAPAIVAQWTCPTHGTPQKWVAPGISKKNGREYAGFWTCSTPFCNERPPRQDGAQGATTAQGAPAPSQLP